MNQEYEQAQQQLISEAKTAPLILPPEQLVPILTQKPLAEHLAPPRPQTPTAQPPTLQTPTPITPITPITPPTTAPAIPAVAPATPAAAVPPAMPSPQTTPQTPPAPPTMPPPPQTTLSTSVPKASGVARVLAVGVGGAGTNAINHMIQVGISGVEFVAMNTDAQALELAQAPVRLRLGETLTRGLGAGGDPSVGQQAAQESYQTIRERLRGANMVFITAGMGGGTGTGASPLVAQAAREEGALTVAVVTTPFAFERRRKQIAADGIEKLRDAVDALIVVPNERLMALNPHELGAFEAYRLADDVLRQGIQGISDLITVPGLINLDFADIQAVMKDTGSAWMAMSRAQGEHRAEEAAHAVLSNPLLEVDLSSARSVIFNITAGDDLTMAEVSQVAEVLANAVHPEANIIFGTVHDPSLMGAIKLTVVATGFESRPVHPNFRAAARSVPPVPRTTAQRPAQKPVQQQYPGMETNTWVEKQPPWTAPQLNDAPQLPDMPQRANQPNQTAARPLRTTVPQSQQFVVGKKVPENETSGERERREERGKMGNAPAWEEPEPPARLGTGYRRSRRPLPPTPGPTTDEEIRMRRLEELRTQRERAMSSSSTGQRDEREEADEYVAGDDDDVPSRRSWKRLFGRH